MRKYIWLVTLSLILSTMLGWVTLSHAQSSEQTGTIAQFLEITPVKFDQTINKGETKNYDVTIRNRHITPIKLAATFDNVVSGGENGEVEPTTENTPWDLKSWAAPSVGQFTLAPKESRKVSTRITAPADASPGGHYGMIRFSPVDRTDLPSVAITGDIAALFLVRVPGPVKEAGFINDFYVAKSDGAKAGWFFFGNGLTFVTRIHNDGNVHFATAPVFTARDQFGNTTTKAISDSTNVFPQSNRKFETSWKNIRTGWYTAKVETTLPNQTATKTVKVLVVTPLFAGLLAGLVLVIIIVIIRRRRKKTKHSLG